MQQQQQQVFTSTFINYGNAAVCHLKVKSTPCVTMTDHTKTLLLLPESDLLLFTKCDMLEC